jgi:hypothetical protein
VATPRSRRRPPRARSRRPAVVLVALAALAVGGWAGWRAYVEGHATLRFAREGASAPDLTLTFFPTQMAFASPSPPPALGRARAGRGADLTVGGALVPGRGVVRYEGEGVGTGFAYVELGADAPTIQLRPQASLRGRVGEPVYFWCMGWRCAGYRPIADAEVVVMGGGEHGVDLVSTRTNEQGAFEVAGFDGALDALGLRVRAPGFELVHEHLASTSWRDDDRALVTTTRVPPRRGRLVVEPGLDLDPTAWTVLARGLPGVQARPDAAGRFVLDHVSPDVEARVIVYGLPARVAQADVRTAQGQEVAVAIRAGAVVRGRVLADNQRPLAGALVWIDAQRPVRADADGAFELPNLMPGARKIVAQWKPARRRARPRLASRELTLEPGATYERVELVIER